MTTNTFDDSFEEPEGNDRRKIIIGGAVGAVALIAVAVLALSGGSSSDTENGAIPRGHPKGALAASPSAAAAAPEAAIATTNVSSTDPFQVPTRILQALAPPAPVAAATTAAAGTTGTTDPTTGTPGTTGVGLPDSTGTATTAPATPSVQFVQLLGAKKSGSRWAVTVRTNHGTCTGIKEGAVKVCGTDFSFAGEDESLGRSTFVFVFGEVQGGNLVPDAAQKPKPVKAGPNALVAVNGKVDGGLTADN